MKFFADLSKEFDDSTTGPFVHAEPMNSVRNDSDWTNSYPETDINGLEKSSSPITSVTSSGERMVWVGTPPGWTPDDPFPTKTKASSPKVPRKTTPRWRRKMRKKTD